jgi:hypothetical protein
MPTLLGADLASYLGDLTRKFPVGLCSSEGFPKSVFRLHSLKSRYRQANPQVLGSPGES